MDSVTYNQIKTFTTSLGRRRTGQDDRDLLDLCEQYLNLLLAEVPEPAAEAPVCVTTPYLGGTGAEGQTLNCTMGEWSGEPTAYQYQWLRDGAPNGAPGASNDYVVTAEDVGHVLSCVVTASNAAGSGEAPPSNLVAAA